LIEEGNPNWITTLFVERPIIVLLIGTIVLFLMSILSFQLGYFSLSDQNGRDFLIWDNSKVIDFDKQVAGREAI